jgi:hypothetical protein
MDILHTLGEVALRHLERSLAGQEYDAAAHVAELDALGR